MLKASHVAIVALSSWFLLGTLAEARPPLVSLDGHAHGIDAQQGLPLFKWNLTFESHGNVESQIARYTSTRGATLATERLTLKGTDLVEFSFHRATDQIEAGVKVENDRVRYWRKEKDQALEWKTRRKKPNLLVGPQVIYFIREHWHDLIAGEKKYFWLSVPERMTSYRFLVRKSDEQPTRGRTLFFLEPRSFVISWFVNPIEFYVHTDSKKLESVKGQVLLTDKHGDHLTADFRFVD